MDDEVAPLPRWLPALKLVAYVVAAALLLTIEGLTPVVQIGIVLVFILPVAAAGFELVTGRRAGRRRLGGGDDPDPGETD